MPDPIAEALSRRRRQTEIDASLSYDPIAELAARRGNRAGTAVPAPTEADVWLHTLRRDRRRIEPGELLARSTRPTYDDTTDTED